MAAKFLESSFCAFVFVVQATSIVATANELFTLAFHMRKKKRSRSCGDQSSVMTKEVWSSANALVGIVFNM